VPKKIYNHFFDAKKKQKKRFAVLIDPDKMIKENLPNLCGILNYAKVDFIFVGGSLLLESSFDDYVKEIKAHTNIPVIIFPGSNLQISNHADGILLLSLISGRNPDFLIGQHVTAAPRLYKSKLEIISTGYILVDSGQATTASYMSGTTPIPANKNDIAICTALAGNMLGLSTIYLDGGSGAKNTVPTSMIKAVSQAITRPLIVGGGIKTTTEARIACEAGADIIVVGNAIEKDSGLIKKMSDTIHQKLVSK